MTAVESALARKLNRFMALGRDELAALAALEAPHRPVAAGSELIHERQAGQRAFILQQGWACCYKLLPDGGRQVIDFRLPGRLHRPAQRAAAHRRPLVRRGHRPRRRRGAGAADARHLPPLPRLGAAILWAASRDEAMVVEHLVGIGRRTPWPAPRISWSSSACACSWWASATRAAMPAP